MAPLLALAAGLLGASLNGRFALKGKREEGSASVKVKEIDDATAFRQDLLGQLREQDEKIDRQDQKIGRLEQQIDAMTEQRRRSARRITDLEIAIRRLLSRFEEYAHFLSGLLRAEGVLGEADARQARALLKLVETDREMFAQMEREHADLLSSQADQPRPDDAGAPKTF